MQENFSEVAENLVSRFGERCADGLRRALAEELRPTLEAELSHARMSAISELARDLVRLLQAGNQVEILTVLLQSTQAFAARAGLLILREGTYIGWQSRGMKDAAAFTRASVPAADRLMERIAKERQPLTARAEELGAGLRASAPSGDAEVWLLPLVIRGRVAGVVYADGGETSSRPVQWESMHALVLIACLAIEAGSLRKPAGSGAVQPAPSPQAARPPQYEAQSVSGQPPLAARTTSPAPPAAAVSPEPPAAPETELRAKARRFAKLLVEEIQLYNQAKVTEGRANRDLYDRLREDIEKSRATYQRRFGESVQDADFFAEELVRILADNDRRLLGSSFPG